MNPSIQEGTKVKDESGRSFGTVVALTDAHVIIERGFFFPRGYYVPWSDLGRYDEEEQILYLQVSVEEALKKGWDRLPK